MKRRHDDKNDRVTSDHGRRALDEPDDDILIGAIAGGDKAAFHALMERHSRSYLALAQRLTGSADDADEVVQEAFLRVWTTAPQWRPGGEARFTTWFYRVVANLCLDRRRRKASAPLEEAGELVDPMPGGLDERAAWEGRAMVAAAMAELPERQRAAIALYYFSEVSGPEAAEMMDLSVSALESLLVRGRRALRKALADLGVKDMGDVL